MIAALRRIRLTLWMAGIRVRLRRHGVRFDRRLGRNVRFAGRPRLDVYPHGSGGGSLRLTIGDDVRVGRDLVLEVQLGKDHTVAIGEGSVLQDHVRLQCRGGTFDLADHVEVRDFVELKSAGVLALGSHVICGRSSTLHCEARVTLGAHVGLAERVTIIDSDHGQDGGDQWFMDRPLLVESVVLEDNAFVAANALVLRGSTIGRNAVVGAGAVVAGLDVPAGHLAAGVPARTIKDLRPESA